VDEGTCCDHRPKVMADIHDLDCIAKVHHILDLDDQPTVEKLMAGWLARDGDLLRGACRAGRAQHPQNPFG
jgi:hypothetical protein